MSRSDSSHPAPRSLNVRWNLGLSPSTRFCRWNLRPVQSSFRNTMESPSPAALVGTSAAGATENTHLRPVLLRDLDPQYGRGSSSEPVAHFLLGRRDDNIQQLKSSNGIHWYMQSHLCSGSRGRVCSPAVIAHFKPISILPSRIQSSWDFMYFCSGC